MFPIGGDQMNETLQSALSPLRDLPDRLAASEALGRLSDPIRVDGT